MNKFSGVSYIRPSLKEHPLSHEQNAAINDLKRLAAHELTGLLQNLFDGIDDSFFELANNSRTNNEQNRFFEAMREIRIKRKSVETKFLLELQKQFLVELVADQDTPNNAALLQSPFGIINREDELEKEVAINAMTAKAQTNFQQLLTKIDKHLPKLYGTSNQPLTNPLNPLSVCGAFSSACKELEIELKERLIVLKHFDLHVMSKFDQVLSPVANALANCDHYEQNKTSVKISSSDTAVTNQTPNQQPTLQGLLERVRQLHTNAAMANETTSTTESQGAQDLASALNVLQKHDEKALKLNIRNPSAPNTHTKLKIQDRLSQLNSYQTDKSDRDLIHLVEMLFEFILEDYNLAPQIQAILASLQIPILKIVLNDKAFFSSNHHPARELLNNLAKAGIGWTNNTTPQKDLLLEKIEHTALTILKEFNNDTVLFEALNDELKAFVSKESKRATIAEARTKSAEEGRLKSLQAQRKVESTLSAKIVSTHHPIPDIVIDILKNGWARVMFLAYLNDSKYHQWRNSVKIADELIWCVQPRTSEQDRQKWITTVPKLLKELKQGLERVSYKSSDLDGTIKELQQTLVEIYKSEAHTAAPATKTNHHASEKKQSVPLNQAPHFTKQPNVAEPTPGNKDTLGAPDGKKAGSSLDHLKTGQWFEFKRDNGQANRCKLSSINHDADCYIFVNRLGLKALEKTSKELAEDLASKRATLLSSGQIIDRALQSVIANLRLK